MKSTTKFMLILVTLTVLMTFFASAEVIMEWDVEDGVVGPLNNGAPNPFTDINPYDGIIVEVTDTLSHSGTKSILMTQPVNEAGVELIVQNFNTPTLYTRKYEYYGSEYEGNWPVGLKTSRYFTNGNAYMSEKLIWQGYDGDPDDLYARGMNNAIYLLDLEDWYTSSELFGNNLPYIRANHWYKYETWLVLDSAVDASDGILKIWIDDVLVYSNTQTPWRSTARGTLGGQAWTSMWFGGLNSYATFPFRGTKYRYIDDLYLSTTLDRNMTIQPDNESPSQVTNLQASAVTNDSITLTWDAATDNVGIFGYTVIRNTVNITTIPTRSFTDLNLVPLTNYTYTIVAHDYAGNTANESLPLHVMTLNTSLYIPPVINETNQTNTTNTTLPPPPVNETNSTNTTVITNQSITINVDSTYPLAAYDAYHLIDSDLMTAWASAESHADPHWVELIFNTTQNVSGVVVHWAYNENRFSYAMSQELQVQYWNGSAYSTLAQIGGNDNNESTTVLFTPTLSTQFRVYQPVDMGYYQYNSVLWLTELEFLTSQVAQEPLLVCTPVHEADITCGLLGEDTCGIGPSELGTYISRFFNGEVTITQIIEVIGLWKNKPGC